MAARPWTVSPHGPLEKLEENLWVVEGAVPTPGGIRRRMVIVRRRDGSLWFFHAIPLAEDALAEVLAWGRPEVLVVGHHQHAIDAAPFAERLGLRIYGPRACEAQLRARPLPLAGTLEDLPQDPDVRFESMDGTRTGEAVCIVRSGSRVSVSFADCCQNNPSDGMFLPFRWLGFSGGPKVVPVFRTFFTSDRRALRAHFDRLAGMDGLARVIPFHGTIVERDPAAALRATAATL
jgi:hypothetical protein